MWTYSRGSQDIEAPRRIQGLLFKFFGYPRIRNPNMELGHASRHLCRPVGPARSAQLAGCRRLPAARFLDEDSRSIRLRARAARAETGQPRRARGRTLSRAVLGYERRYGCGRKTARSSVRGRAFVCSVRIDSCSQVMLAGIGLLTWSSRWDISRRRDRYSSEDRIAMQVSVGARSAGSAARSTPEPPGLYGADRKCSARSGGLIHLILVDRESGQRLEIFGRMRVLPGGVGSRAAALIERGGCTHHRAR